MLALWLFKAMRKLLYQGYIERAIISKISAVNVLLGKEYLLHLDFGQSIFQSVCNMFRKYFVNLYMKIRILLHKVSNVSILNFSGQKLNHALVGQTSIHVQRDCNLRQRHEGAQEFQVLLVMTHRLMCIAHCWCY